MTQPTILPCGCPMSGCSQPTAHGWGWTDAKTNIPTPDKIPDLPPNYGSTLGIYPPPTTSWRWTVHKGQTTMWIPSSVPPNGLYRLLQRLLLGIIWEKVG